MPETSGRSHGVAAAKLAYIGALASSTAAQGANRALAGYSIELLIVVRYLGAFLIASLIIVGYIAGRVARAIFRRDGPTTRSSHKTWHSEILRANIERGVTQCVVTAASFGTARYLSVTLFVVLAIPARPLLSMIFSPLFGEKVQNRRYKLGSVCIALAPAMVVFDNEPAAQARDLWTGLALFMVTASATSISLLQNGSGYDSGDIWRTLRGRQPADVKAQRKAAAQAESPFLGLLIQSYVGLLAAGSLWLTEAMVFERSMDFPRADDWSVWLLFVGLVTGYQLLYMASKKANAANMAVFTSLTPVMAVVVDTTIGLTPDRTTLLMLPIFMAAVGVGTWPDRRKRAA